LEPNSRRADAGLSTRRSPAKAATTVSNALDATGRPFNLRPAPNGLPFPRSASATMLLKK
jgi:hypothetical protein